MSVRLAQIFGVYGGFTPTKASAFFRPNLVTEGTFFEISPNVTIDALNFSSITQSSNKIIPEDDYANFTGSGYWTVEEFDASSSYPSANYPIHATTVGTYNIWFRTRGSGGVLTIEVRLDGDLIGTISDIAAPAGWDWNSISHTLPDTGEHTLNVSILVGDAAIDKIYITSNLVEIPVGLGADYSNSPYITVHAQLYTVDLYDNPDMPLFTYDYKTTLDELKTDDWYNFDMHFLDESRAVESQDKYALVVFSSGSNDLEYIVWEMSDADPYIDGPSAIYYPSV